MALVVKNPPANAGDVKDIGLIPGSGRCPEGGHSNLFQHKFCLKIHMDRGAWLATVHRVANNPNVWACTHAHALTPTGSWLKILLGRMYSNPHVCPAAYNCVTAEDSGSQRKPNNHSSVQLLSHVRLFATPGTAASVMSSNHFTLSPPFSPTFNLSQHQGLFNESVLHIRWPKFWSFNFSNSSSNEYSGLIIL